MTDDRSNRDTTARLVTTGDVPKLKRNIHAYYRTHHSHQSGIHRYGWPLVARELGVCISYAAKRGNRSSFAMFNDNVVLFVHVRKGADHASLRGLSRLGPRRDGALRDAARALVLEARRRRIRTATIDAYSEQRRRTYELLLIELAAQGEVSWTLVAGRIRRRFSVEVMPQGISGG